MAQLVNLLSRIERVREEYFVRIRIAEENRALEHAAAVKIQSWFRGCQTRAYLRYLNKKATLMQKIWRGFSARRIFRKMLEAAFFTRKMNLCNQMAVRIQKTWRGYYVRQYVHNYYARKIYLEGLTRKNEEVRKTLEEFAEFQRRMREQERTEREEREKCILAQKMHFLLSTKQCPGVYNSPFRDSPGEMELRMRSAKPPLAKSPSRHKDRIGKKMESPTEAGSATHLPPIRTKKPQGPFRQPLEVWQQRYRPLEPTLRVATSITALEEAREELRREEWRGRVVDHPFHPFSNTSRQSEKYEPLIHASAPFEQVAYGTKHFREEKKEILQEKEPFKTVFTSCQVFDKFGRLYSNAGKIV
ncbi:spermatogenesis-associated protein 17 [Denticeps clupeoides]|uniref:Spermatogenesis associated 17 n=1 Tax=Denticeps clupeoides TaxID=299321 RepID=A0AAY4AF77_9TELE|nr:spermatogenesis-associated protein 17 [Denticeps clupeoides]